MADIDREESALGLQQLEPSPVEETPGGQPGGDGYFPSSSTSTTSKGTHHLGLSAHHSSIWYLSRIQKYSSYVFSAFAAAHITNTSLIPLITRSVPASEPYLLLTRPYYQGLPAEPFLIIIPLYAHVLSGLGLRVARRNLAANRYGESAKDWRTFFSTRFWPPVSGISKLGIQLTPLLIGHAFINRAVPQKFAGGSSNVNLSYVSHAFARHPAISFAGFTALLTVGCFHITWGWAKWLSLTPDQTTETGSDRQLSKKRRWYIINGIAAAVTAVWMAGSFGVVGRGGEALGWVGKAYDEMYRSIPIVGRWM